jgi:hypothetical protein
VSFTIADLLCLRDGALRAARRGFPVRDSVAFARDANRRAVRLAIESRRSSLRGHGAETRAAIDASDAASLKRLGVDGEYRLNPSRTAWVFNGKTRDGEVIHHVMDGRPIPAHRS